MAKRTVIIDSDMGVDDATAILVAAKHKDVEVKAITVVRGNVPLSQGVKNAQTLVRLLKAQNKIRIYAGADEPIVEVSSPCIPYEGHGQDGLGNHEENYSRNILMSEKEAPVEQEHAVNALVNYAREFSGQLEIHCLAPLTNLALAYKLDKSFFHHLKKLYVMGGSEYGQGNANRAAEFNFFEDPEAAHIVFSAVAKLNRKEPLIDLVTFECCIRHGLEWSFYHDTLTVMPRTPLGEFLKSITNVMETMARKEAAAMEGTVDENAAAVDNLCYSPCDCYATIAGVDPSSVLKYQDYHVDIELTGRHTRGMVAIDWYKRETNNPMINCRIIRDMDNKVIRRILTETFTK